MTIAGVADTHTAVWYLFDDSRMSDAATSYIEAAARDGRKIAVSSISLVELIYLVEKGRLTAYAYDYLSQALANPEHVFTEAPLTRGIVEAMRLVPRQEVPDMPDRIVAATAMYLGVPVISRDGRIRGSHLETVW